MMNSPSHGRITREQFRAARELLGWSIGDVCARVPVEPEHVSAVEFSDPALVRAESLLEEVYRKAGVTFETLFDETAVIQLVGRKEQPDGMWAVAHQVAAKASGGAA